jgi:hypothetical protein
MAKSILWLFVPLTASIARGQVATTAPSVRQFTFVYNKSTIDYIGSPVFVNGELTPPYASELRR